MRATGIDIYQKYQPNYVHQGHHDFIILKVSDGSLSKEFERLYAQSELVPLKIAYHYLRSGMEAQRQIDAFLNTMEGYHFDGVAIDFEKIGNSPSMQFGQILHDTLLGVKAETNKRTLLYSSPSIIQEWLFWYGHTTWVREWPLWIAQWPYYGWNDVMYNVPLTEEWQPRLPAGTVDWKIWQYSADKNKKGPENGIMKKYAWSVAPSVDMDVYNGTPAEMMEWFNVTQPPTPPPPSNTFPIDVVGILDSSDDDIEAVINIELRRKQ